MLSRLALSMKAQVLTTRTSAAPGFAQGLKVTKTGKIQKLSTTQLHGSLEGRDLYRIGTLAEYQEHKDFATHPPHAESHAPAFDLSLIPPQAPDFVPSIGISLGELASSLDPDPRLQRHMVAIFVGDDGGVCFFVFRI